MVIFLIDQNVVFVISLFYLNLNILDDVDYLFVQNFWNLQQSSKNVIKVGVLIKQINSIERNKKEIILINLGGGESRLDFIAN